MKRGRQWRRIAMWAGAAATLLCLTALLLSIWVGGARVTLGTKSVNAFSLSVGVAVAAADLGCDWNQNASLLETLSAQDFSLRFKSNGPGGFWAGRMPWLEAYGLRPHLTYSPGWLMCTIPLWKPFLLFGISTVVLWRRERHRHAPGTCRKCGYNLAGNVTGRCPECGAAARTESAEVR